MQLMVLRATRGRKEIDVPTVLLSSPDGQGRRVAPFTIEVPRFPLVAHLQLRRPAISEVLGHISGLYFRGKLAYPLGFGGTTLVITPERGLDERRRAAVEGA
jgi:hypothetical protein